MLASEKEDERTPKNDKKPYDLKNVRKCQKIQKKTKKKKQKIF